MVSEEAKHGRPRVELIESVAEARVRDDASPTLADEGGVDKACGVTWRDAEEDRLHEFIHQHHRHTAYCRSDICWSRCVVGSEGREEWATPPPNEWGSSDSMHDSAF